MNDELVLGAGTCEEVPECIASFTGWGMRIIFGPDDETEREPRIEVREPRGDHR
jgi:hypothetical protein